jgi:hypothetical protein
MNVKMNESQLMQTFSCLTLKDRRALRLFLRSPFHNTREDVVLLFDYLDNNWEKANRDFKKETVFNVVFNAESVRDDRRINSPAIDVKTAINNGLIYSPEKMTSFNLKKLNYTLSFLDNLIRDYLILNQLNTEQTEKDLLLEKAFILRGADKLAEKTLTHARQYFDAQPIQNATAHFHDFRLHRAHYDRVSRQERSDDTSLQASADAFTDFIMAETLRQACSMLTQHAFSKRKYELPLLEPILNFIELKLINLKLKKEDNFELNSIDEKPIKSVISIAVLAYYHAYQSLSKEGDSEVQFAHFQELRYILENNWHQFPPEEMRGLYIVAINFCLKKINRGNREFESEVLSLYKIGLKNRLLFENNQLSPYTYKNTMMAALKVGEMAWASQFLDDYKVFLPANDREMLFKYNKALYFFRNNDYESAMKLLQTVNLREALFNLDARRLLARIYFELKEITALMSLIDNSKIYLHRQKEIGYHREMYVNFFKILEILLKTDPKKTKLLRGLIDETKYLAEREWLLGKLEN